MEAFQALNLAPDVVARYQRRFNAIDLNKDGVITLREMAAVSKVFGYKLSIEELGVRKGYTGVTVRCVCVWWGGGDIGGGGGGEVV